MAISALAAPPVAKIKPLDLRPPTAREITNRPAETANAKSLDRFPSGHWADSGSDERFGAFRGADPGTTRPKGAVQAFAERFHHEGLPVARLWENHSALVSFGLNQKGKPGLWLVQKTH